MFAEPLDHLGTHPCTTHVLNITTYYALSKPILTTMDVQKTIDNLVLYAELDKLFQSGSVEIFPSSLQQQQTLITAALAILSM